MRSGTPAVPGLVNFQQSPWCLRTACTSCFSMFCSIAILGGFRGGWNKTGPGFKRVAELGVFALFHYLIPCLYPFT